MGSSENQLGHNSCSYCGRVLPAYPGRGRHAYCPPPRECAREARRQQVREAIQRFTEGLPANLRKARQNAYRFIRRQALSRRQLLTGPAALLVGAGLETWPATPTPRHEAALKRLRTLREALIRGDTAVVTHGALALQELLSADRSACAYRIRTHCEELLRDVGEPVDFLEGCSESEKTFRALERRARAIEKQWVEQKNLINLSWALLSRANLYRIHERYQEALKLINGTHWILNGLCQWENRRAVNILLHQTALWKIRLLAVHLGEVDEAEPHRGLLMALTEEIGSPNVELQTLREEARCFLAWREPDLAAPLIEKAQALRQILPSCSAITDQTLLRPEIELLLMRDKNQARERVRDYGRVWQKAPTSYHLRQLLALQKECGLTPSLFALEERVFSTPVLIPLYMEEELTRL